MDGLSFEESEHPNKRSDSVAGLSDKASALEPIDWEPGLLVGTFLDDTSSSTYWYYDRLKEELNWFHYDVDGSESLGSQEWKGEWSHVVAFARDSGDVFVGYNSELGALEALALRDGQLVELCNATGSIGRTHLLTLTLGGKPSLFSYNTGTGEIRVSPLGDEDDAVCRIGANEVDPCDTLFEPGWSQVVPFQQGDDEGVLFFKEETAEVRFLSLLECEQTPRKVFSQVLKEIPKLVFTYEPLPGSFYLYFEGGELRRHDVLSIDGENITSDVVDLGMLEEDITAVAALRASDQAALLTYSQNSGIGQITSLGSSAFEAPIK